MKLLLFGILLVLAVSAAAGIIFVATDTPDASGKPGMPDPVATAVPSPGEWNPPDVSPTSSPDVPLYDPADFTIAASGPDLSPDDLFAAAITLLNNYTALFGNTVAPVSLSDSCLSEASRNLRGTLSDSALFASLVSEGSTGISSSVLTENETLAAYGFRVLPTGQTVTYAYTVTAGAGDAAYAAAGQSLQEWLHAVDELTKNAADSIVSRAAETEPVADSGWISSRGDIRDYGEFGKVGLHSAWYWDSGEQDHDWFYTMSEITMTPGTVTRNNFYKNHRFTLTIDPGYSNPGGNAPHLPGVSISGSAPAGGRDGQPAVCVLRSLSWITDIPDASFAFDCPAGGICKWDGTIHPFGNQAKQTFIFKAGVQITGSQSESRNGSTYTLSKNTVDVYHGFSDGLFSSGPDTNCTISQELHIRWHGGKYSSV
ncbi:MAG: hypothetical protein O0X93_03075 [Methanocorpusculum sp.]|nr:hypothetical protein [Methanocorpusculum sp.]MDE2524325.1 hypothetical protein [Methanocorpusculum sp.]